MYIYVTVAIIYNYEKKTMRHKTTIYIAILIENLN